MGLLKKRSLQRVTSDSDIWAGVSAAVFVTARRYYLRKGRHCELCGDTPEISRDGQSDISSDGDPKNETTDVAHHMKTDACIRFAANNTEFIELSEIQRFPDDSGYVSMIRVRSGEFTFLGKEFYFTDLTSFLHDLKKSYESVRGHVELRTQYKEELVRRRVCPL